jgi:tRNA(Ile)-lysidine synthetase-like protein
VVGLSGSSDSVALAYLAKQTFQKVLAMTVNLNMNEENARRAEMVSEIAASLGVEHHMVTLEWAEGERMTESVARHRRYPALMEQCRKAKAGILMVGHSQDDQIETAVYRLSKSSGLEGLGGMMPLSYWADYPDVGIARPFLDCSRQSLEDLCREVNLPWIERVASESERTHFKSVPRKYRDLRDGLLQLISLCREARDVLHPHVTHTVHKLPSFDTLHGAVSFPTSIYQALNPAVARRALSVWARYIGGVSEFRYDLINSMHRLLCTPGRPNTMTGSSVMVTVDNNQKTATIARRSPDSKNRVRVPIRVGETILWDSRFKITLVPKDFGKDMSRLKPSDDSPVYYVRHLVKNDWIYMSKGRVRYRVPVCLRSGLPVVVDEDKNVVLIPHFKLASREANVRAVVKFRPASTVENLLEYSHYHKC